MIYTVTFNPSLDYVVDVEGFKTGVVNRTVSEHIMPGGKGVNVSIVLSNLGMKNKALGFVGGFTGAALEEQLDKKGIATDFVRLEGQLTRINVKLRSDEESEINGQGPHISKENIEELYKKLDRLSADDYLVLAGSIPATMPKSMYLDIMTRLKDRGIRIIVDATNELLLNVLPIGPFLIKPNNHELGEMFGTEIKDKADVIKYGRLLQEKGAQNVLVSMAGDGAVLIASDGKIYQSEAPRGELKNSVGAGDSMVAGFITGFIEGGNYEKAFQMGICTGSASAFSEELATRPEVMALMEKTF